MEFDILILNATIVDGLGTPASAGSIGISGDRIAAIGDLDGATAPAGRIIDAAGLVVCPGFIDPHSHADLTLHLYPLAENLVMQGITTFVGGNCSLAPAPIAGSDYTKELTSMTGVSLEPEWKTYEEWLARLDEIGPSLNVVPLAGHTPVRLAVMGSDFKRLATPAEIRSMQGLLEEAMRAGARGFSTFGDSSPCEAAVAELVEATEPVEVTELLKTTARCGGLYVPHTRHIDSQWYSDDPEEYGYGIYHGPVEEAWVGRYRGYLQVIELSRQVGIPLHIAHLAPAFIMPQPHPCYLDESAALATLEIIDRALDQGVDVTFDTIPSSSSIASERALLGEFQSFTGSRPNAGELFRTEDFRNEIKRKRDAGRLKLGMVHTKADPYWSDCFKVSRCKDQALVGMAVGDIAAERGQDPLDVLFDILAEDPEAAWFQFMDKRLMPAAVSILLQHPAAMPGSDMIAFPGGTEADQSSSASLFGGKPPAIGFGLFAHYLGTYVRQEKILSLEEAVRKATSFPASRFGIRDRGKLVPGAYADLLLIDPDRIAMKGDFKNPARPPDGIECVVVNGQVVYEHGTHTGARPGRVLRRS